MGESESFLSPVWLQFDPYLIFSQARYIDYFELREKRKEEMIAYHDASIMKKGSIDLETSEFPMGQAPKWFNRHQ